MPNWQKVQRIQPQSSLLPSKSSGVSVTPEIDSDSVTHHTLSQPGSHVDQPSSCATSSDADAVSYRYGGFVPDDDSEGLVEMHDVKLEVVGPEKKMASRYKVCRIQSSFNAGTCLTFPIVYHQNSGDSLNAIAMHQFRRQ